MPALNNLDRLVSYNFIDETRHFRGTTTARDFISPECCSLLETYYLDQVLSNTQQTTTLERSGANIMKRFPACYRTQNMIDSLPVIQLSLHAGIRGLLQI